MTYSILGWDADGLMGRDFADTCLPVRIRDDMKAKFAEMIAGDFAVLENPILTKTGVERLIGWRNTLLRDDAGRAASIPRRHGRHHRIRLRSIRT